MRLLFQICRKVSAGRVGPGSKTRPVAANHCGRIGKMRPRTLLYNRFRNHRSRRGKSECGVSVRPRPVAATVFRRICSGDPWQDNRSPLVPSLASEGRLPTADRLCDRFPGQGAVAGGTERPPGTEGIRAAVACRSGQIENGRTGKARPSRIRHGGRYVMPISPARNPCGGAACRFWGRCGWPDRTNRSIRV